MVNLAGLSADEQDLIASVTAFVDDHVIPVAAGRDSTGEYPSDLITTMADLGLFAACEQRLEVYALICEEIARGWVSLAPVLNAHSSMVWALKHYGTPAQRQRWLPDLLTGRRKAALGLTEPHAGSDLKAIKSTARVDGDELVVDARKSYITHADHADLLMMLVRTDTADSTASTGLSLIVLDRGEYEIVRRLDKLGSRSVETCELTVDSVRIPLDRIVSESAGRGFYQVMDCLEVGRIAVSAAAVGVGRAALWTAVSYVSDRHAFGQPIAQFQAVTTALGKTATQLAAARSLVLQAAADKQLGGRHDVVTSAAKVFAAETAVSAALTAMELHGGAGYLRDHDAERFLRDATLYLAGEGSNSMLSDLIGRRLIGQSTSLSWI